MHTKYSLTTTLAEQNEETNAKDRLAFPSTHLSRNTEIDWIFLQLWTTGMNGLSRVKSQTLNWYKLTQSNVFISSVISNDEKWSH